MKKTYIYISLTLIISIIITIYIFKTNTHKTIPITTPTYTKINKIDESHKTKIKIYYPITPYQKLNKSILSIINTSINSFKEDLSYSPHLEDTYYTFYILYDEYTYKNYLSYIFYLEYFTGGAHPYHTIKTINYNTSTNKIITIEDLLKINPLLLPSISNISREKLKTNPKFTTHLDINMLNNGTSPLKENFQNFTLTPSGLKVYFDYYQIAPYYYGYSEITIPYQDLSLSL